jgi:hypothetical protein
MRTRGDGKGGLGLRTHRGWQTRRQTNMWKMVITNIGCMGGVVGRCGSFVDRALQAACYKHEIDNPQWHPGSLPAPAQTVYRSDSGSLIYDTCAPAAAERRGETTARTAPPPWLAPAPSRHACSRIAAEGNNLGNSNNNPTCCPGTVNQQMAGRARASHKRGGRLASWQPAMWSSYDNLSRVVVLRGRGTRPAQA